MLQCLMPGCKNMTTRGPEFQVCTKHFIEGWGRLPKMPLPLVKEPIEESQEITEVPLIKEEVKIGARKNIHHKRKK